MLLKLGYVTLYDKQDTINMIYETRTIQCGPYVNDKEDRTSLFYVILIIHDKLLHNCMLDFGASHNLMLKIIMEQLGLEIT